MGELKNGWQASQRIQFWSKRGTTRASTKQI